MATFLLYAFIIIFIFAFYYMIFVEDKIGFMTFIMFVSFLGIIISGIHHNDTCHSGSTRCHYDQHPVRGNNE